MSYNYHSNSYALLNAYNELGIILTALRTLSHVFLKTTVQSSYKSNFKSKKSLSGQEKEI